MDITNFMSWFLDKCLYFFKFVYDTFDSITFFNISLLDYCIALILIPIGVSILIAIAKNPPINKSKRKKHRKRERKERRKGEKN